MTRHLSTDAIQATARRLAHETAWQSADLLIDAVTDLEGIPVEFARAAIMPIMPELQSGREAAAA